jgi:hypothetical protein
MLPVFTTMTSVPPMKQMEERTKKQQNVGQGAKQMRLMFFPKEKGRNGSKSEKRETGSRL